MWTSSSTTSGWVRTTSATASATVPASPTTSTASPSSVRTPARNRRWSSTRATREHRHGIGTSSRTSVPCPGAVRTTARPPWRSMRPTTDCARPYRSVGHRRRVEAAAAVAHEDLDPLPADLGVDLHRLDPGVLGGVHQRLAGRGDQRLPPAGRSGSRRPTTTSTAMPWSSSTSAAASSRARARVRSASSPAPAGAYSQPRSSRSCVRARRLTSRRSSRLADQGQRLQHRVVHVGGELGPLLRPDALAPLVAQVAGHPEPPRARQHREADDDGDRRQQPLPRLLQLAARREEADEPRHDEHRAADHHERPARRRRCATGRAARRRPAATPAPRRRRRPASGTTAGDDRPSACSSSRPPPPSAASASSCTRSVRRGARRPAPCGTSTHSAAYIAHARTGAQREQQERQAHDQRRQPQVLGDAGGDPAERTPGGRALEAARRGADGGGHAPRLPPRGPVRVRVGP